MYLSVLKNKLNFTKLNEQTSTPDSQNIFNIFKKQSRPEAIDLNFFFHFFIFLILNKEHSEENKLKLTVEKRQNKYRQLNS